jgi:hypothetical protein
MCGFQILQSYLIGGDSPSVIHGGQAHGRVPQTLGIRLGALILHSGALAAGCGELGHRRNVFPTSDDRWSSSARLSGKMIRKTSRLSRCFPWFKEKSKSRRTKAIRGAPGKTRKSEESES